MRKSLNRRSLDELIKSNIRDLENDSKLLEQIENKIEIKHIEKLTKEMEIPKKERISDSSKRNSLVESGTGDLKEIIFTKSRGSEFSHRY